MGVAFFASLVVGTVVEVLSGDWGDRYGNRRMTVAGLALWGAGLIAFAFVTSLVGLVLTLACWSMGQAIYSGAPLALTVNAISAENTALRQAAVRWSQVSRRLSDEARNLVWSTFSAVMGMAMALTDLIFGYAWELTTLTTALFITVGVYAGLSAMGGIALRRLTSRSRGRTRDRDGTTSGVTPGPITPAG